VPETLDECSTLQDYLERLKGELAGGDPALVQDALNDAEEHMRNEIGTAADQHAALAAAIRRFGTPREVAEAYRENDARVAAALAQPPRRPASNIAQRVFGVLLDPRAYGALVFMFLSLVTGILYFVWAVTGLVLSLGFSILIIGLPFILFFVASIRVFSLLEGRLVESLLGVRMPRRPQVRRPEGSFLSRLGARLANPRTWLTLLYMVLKLPLGIASFALFTALMSLSLGLLVAPVAQFITGEPLISLGHNEWIELGPLGFPIFWAAGLVDLLVTMHLARALGKAYGAIAKAMLVDA
jgi:uncharacterized membrane protein